MICADEGLAASPLFGYTEDYSQYVPRGHYSRSEEFQRYFQAMVWYGRMGFHLSPVKQTGGKVVLDKQAEVTETLQALLICRALAVAQVKGEKALDVWNRVYETTCFFAGRSDDLSVRDYATLMDQVYGPQPLLAGLADRGKLAEFIARARRLPKPRILSIAVTDVSSGQVDWQRQEQAMRFMGQRFTPDAHVFQNLVYDRVTRYRGQDPKPFTAVVVSGACFRGWPRGLDLVAVWGCPLAAEILRTEGDTDYDGYEAHFNEMRGLYATPDPSTCTQDLYASRLWALRTLLAEPEPTVPAFMRTAAWRKKQLQTALGSWTELKHDTIVYTKQPYGVAQAAMAGKGGWARYLPAEVVHGYVEPVPQLYAALGQSVAQLREKYVALGFPKDSALMANFQQLEASWPRWRGSRKRSSPERRRRNRSTD